MLERAREHTLGKRTALQQVTDSDASYTESSDSDSSTSDTDES